MNEDLSTAADPAGGALTDVAPADPFVSLDAAPPPPALRERETLDQTVDRVVKASEDAAANADAAARDTKTILARAA